jgi:hypothetical protein
MDIQNKCISEVLFRGIECDCGNIIKFSDFLNAFQTPEYKCSCNKLYKPYLRGYAYPVIYQNKNWEKFEGKIIF